ncbi:MAG: biopolymer transporter ExbD [Bacteriovoracaceae bacterium]|nr:biopolymer transporter ExbD [Bacteriovoracaceae bacterium]
MAIKMDDQEDQIMAEINMTPLIDIMLVLLILFMVTSSVSLESGLDVELPQVAGNTESKEGSAVIISLDNEGRLSVQGKQTTLEDLGPVIKEAMAVEKTGLVILEGDRQSKLGNAVQIMDIAKAAGALKFAIAAESGEAP